MNYKYFHSESLNLPGKVNLQTGDVIIKDGSELIHYSRKELDNISGTIIDKQIHTIKRLFGGFLENEPINEQIECKGLQIPDRWKKACR